MKWLALDIGGANIKAADGRGYARSHPFALWREPSRLVEQIRIAICEAPLSDHLAVTMTGELADCFESKAAGVRFILDAVCKAAESARIHVYLADGRLVPPRIVLESPRLAAASNWHALARFAGRYVARGTGLLIDIGSTTCDIIPIVDGRPAAHGQDDTQRLIAGELVYTGVERSPLCAVVQNVTYRDRACPMAQELFATMRDVYLVLGELPEEPSDTVTADGRPATRVCAQVRLARMLGADVETFDDYDAVVLAQDAAMAQAAQLAKAIKQVISDLPERPKTVILSGHGDFLAREALRRAKLECSTIFLEHELGPVVSRCAPAHALAILASEMAG